MSLFFRLLIIISLHGFSFGQEISEIHFTGLKKTKEIYLLSLMKSKLGQPYDSLTLIEDINILRNSSVFFDVNHELLLENKKATIRIHCKESKALYPIIGLGSIKDNFWFRLGATDVNWRGRGQTIGGFYQYYDRHSFSIYQQNPRAKMGNWGESISFQKHSTLEPLYFNEGPVAFNYDNYSAEILGNYWFNQRDRIDFGAAWMVEKYEKADSTYIEYLGKNTKFSFKKLLTKVIYKLDYINTKIERQKGFSSRFSLENVMTIGQKSLFWKIDNTSKFFVFLGERGNFATRSKIGISANVNSPFAPFVLDSYVNIRGAGNRTARGTAEASLNLEYRHSIIRIYPLIAQVVVFADVGSWRPPNGKFSEMKYIQNQTAFTGTGIRINSQVWYKAVFRLDYAVSLMNSNQKGFVIGFNQYF